MEKDTREKVARWNVQSPNEPGWHVVIAPDRHECQHAHVFRLNLPAGSSYTVTDPTLELHPVLINGAARVEGAVESDLERFDSFYLPAGASATIEAIEDSVFYVGGAVYEGVGEVSLQKWDASQPIGDIHQIHGTGTARREVYFTLPPKTEASRLICGLTWSEQGAWTSWPPHQHEKDLEEVYCYFDMDRPKVGFHFSYMESGGIDDCVVHPVHSGSMVGVPRGYHPTVAGPGSVNAYMWVLAAVRPESRSYDLAVEDPAFVELRG